VAVIEGKRARLRSSGGQGGGDVSWAWALRLAIRRFYGGDFSLAPEEELQSGPSTRPNRVAGLEGRVSSKVASKKGPPRLFSKRGGIAERRGVRPPALP
jgi:hypothetical protein